MPIDKTARDLFGDSGIYFRLAFWSLLFGMWKSICYAFDSSAHYSAKKYYAMHRRIDAVLDPVCEYAVMVFQRRRRELFVFSNCFGWSLSTSLVTIQLLAL